VPVSRAAAAAQPRPPGTRSTALTVAAAVVAVEAVALGGVGVYVALAPRLRDVHDVTLTELEAGGALLFAGLLAWLAAGLHRGRRWARSPVIFLQLLALPPGWGYLRAGQWVYGVPIAVLVVVELVALFRPSAREPFENR
jgi:hypothetical protein